MSTIFSYHCWHVPEIKALVSGDEINMKLELNCVHLPRMGDKKRSDVCSYHWNV